MILFLHEAFSCLEFFVYNCYVLVVVLISFHSLTHLLAYVVLSYMYCFICYFNVLAFLVALPCYLVLLVYFSMSSFIIVIYYLIIYYLFICYLF